MTSKQILQKTGLVDLTAWVGLGPKQGQSPVELQAPAGHGSAVEKDSTQAWRQARLQSTFSVYPALVSSVAFSGDGQALICGHSVWGRQPSTTIKVWHRPTQALLHSFLHDSVGALAVGAIAKHQAKHQFAAPASQTPETTENVSVLVSSSADDGAVRVWNFKTKALLHTLKDHTAGVKAVAIAPHGQTIASGSYDNSVKLWHATTGKLERTLCGHTDTVSGVAFDPQSQVLASSSHDQTIKLWDAQSGELLSTLVGHTNQVTALAFSPDGTILASTSEDATIRLWKLSKDEAPIVLSGHVGGVLAIAFSPDGQTLASGGVDGKVKLWCVKTGQLIRTLGQGWNQWLPSHTKSVSAVSFSPDGSSLASGQMDGTVKLWCCAR
jgi:WD40 repeat protein